MPTKETKIAELSEILPMFISVLLEGSDIKSEVKLNYSEEKTLLFLNKHEGNQMTDYCKKVGLTKGSFTSVVDLLVNKELVERISMCNDRRKYALVLTKKGKGVAQKIDTEYKKHISQKVAALNDESISELLYALEIINNTLDMLK
ncbi:hypothetical protein GC105_08700 [Alkalibaculum sp. M08DMB]|uniref:HTH marR-type domain-containing protein n=1 Tax=Alkalibaculum sporogenes TaxID=2655001 RepID=A0A6A7K9K5_9FIRM|nr:hypothetical protein [Alkalibaculum sporogenes]MPW25867.1 hypothetical protein [Alkalibaculum sporogenes]